MAHRALQTFGKGQGGGIRMNEKAASYLARYTKSAE